MSESNLERQLEEFVALAAMYDEFVVNDEEAVLRARAACDGLLPVGEVGTLSAAVQIPLLDGKARATLSVVLPAAYPTTAQPEVNVSCVMLCPSAHATVSEALRLVAGEAVAEQRESLLDLCLALQHAGDEQLALTASAAPTAAPPSLSAAAEGPHHGRCMLWFHHIKSVAKRKEIVSLARASRLGGFCKPGFPGVIVCEGEDTEVDSFVHSLRALRWQAMDVRYETTGPPAELPLLLPTPFVELSENGMGEAAALCERAGLLAPFRTSVLKLADGASGREGGASGKVDTSEREEGMHTCPYDGQPGPPALLTPPCCTPPPSVPLPAYRLAEKLTSSPAQSSQLTSSHFADKGGEGGIGTLVLDRRGMEGHATNRPPDELEHELVLHIDHMNDAGGYMRTLGKWVGQLGLRGRLYFSRRGVRHADVLVVLQGEAEPPLRAFLQRLRTQHVDTDRGGRPCKERQASVLHQCALQNGRVRLAGWSTAEYSDSEELHAALRSLGLSETSDLVRTHTCRRVGR